jgi:methyl halide transferase
VKFVIEDFFEYKYEGGFDVIYDPHFLCSLHPSQRTNWAKKMKSLMKKDGCLITLIYPVFEKERKYPPYTMSAEL